MRFSKNSEAFASEFLESLKEILIPMYNSSVSPNKKIKCMNDFFTYV